MIIGLMAALALGAAPPDAQDAAVIATVQRFFDAMAKEDRAAIAEVVLPGTMFTSVQLAEGETRMSRVTVEDFAKTLRPGLGERIWSPRVNIRADLLATVSAPYEFQIDGKTTHCGVDEVTLVKAGGAWKIASLAWTREPGACAELKAR